MKTHVIDDKVFRVFQNISEVLEDEVIVTMDSLRHDVTNENLNLHWGLGRVNVFPTSFPIYV